MNRDWISFRSRRYFAENNEVQWPKLHDSEVQAYLDDKHPEMEAFILRLPYPILCRAGEINDIFQTTTTDNQTIRIYPPFQINSEKESGGAFEDCWVPDGSDFLEKYTEINNEVAKGIVTNVHPHKDDFYCGALRIDVTTGFEFHPLVFSLVEHVCQYTYQWWLRGRANPFNGMVRFSCEIDRKHRLREMLRYSGPESISSTWYTMTEAQNLLGFEQSLNSSTWRICCSNAASGVRAETGLLSFHDGLSYYMARDDSLSIISLSNCVEILCNKHLKLCGKKVERTLGPLLRKSSLIDKENRAALKKLSIDRGHVAHGRNPYKGDMEEYIEATLTVVNRYLNSLAGDKWHKASQLDI